MPLFDDDLHGVVRWILGWTMERRVCLSLCTRRGRGTPDRSASPLNVPWLPAGCQLASGVVASKEEKTPAGKLLEWGGRVQQPEKVVGMVSA